MLFDLRKEIDRQRFAARAKEMLRREAVVELTEKRQRTLSQNAYLHLIIGVVAMETGTALDYAKEVYFKRLCNRDLFIVAKTDRLAGEVEVLRSSADLTKEEMSLAIDRFKRWAAENGMYLPEPGDEALLREIEIEMGRMKGYL